MVGYESLESESNTVNFLEVGAGFKSAFAVVDFEFLLD